MKKLEAVVCALLGVAWLWYLPPCNANDLTGRENQVLFEFLENLGISRDSIADIRNVHTEIDRLVADVGYEQIAATARSLKADTSGSYYDVIEPADESGSVLIRKKYVLTEKVRIEVRLLLSRDVSGRLWQAFLSKGYLPESEFNLPRNKPIGSRRADKTSGPDS